MTFPVTANSDKTTASTVIGQSTKWTGITLLAACVTIGLGVSMAAMIATEFQAKDKLESGAFDINPVEEDIIVETRTVELDQYNRVETPPPPPVLDHGKIEKVTVPPITIEGDPIPFDRSIIKMASMGEINISKDYQPIVRTPPVMPLRADKSGHCQMTFDVSPEGSPFNVRASYCTERYFERASVKSVQGWKYLPRYVEGLAVTVSDVETKISFNLTDDRGNIIPE